MYRRIKPISYLRQGRRKEENEISLATGLRGIFLFVLPVAPSKGRHNCAEPQQPPGQDESFCKPDLKASCLQILFQIDMAVHRIVTAQTIKVSQINRGRERVWEQAGSTGFLGGSPTTSSQVAI